MADSKLPALTETSVPALDDVTYVVDISDTTDDASGSSRKLSIARLIGLVNNVCQGRLTLETGVPVSTSDQTAKTNVYFTPYNGNKVAVYDGTRWKLYAFSELALALGTITSGKNYDVFVYDNAGTLTLELSAAWTNDTTRADALALQDGVSVKSGATTRRWLGTIRTTATTTTEDSEAKRFVWNAQQQVTRRLFKTDATGHSYATATWRPWNNSSTNRIEFISGRAGQALPVLYSAAITSTADTAYDGFVKDSTTAAAEASISFSIAATFGAGCCNTYALGLGYGYVQAIQLAFASATYYAYSLSAEHAC